MVLKTILKALPVGEYMRIFIGVGVVVGFASTPFMLRGAGRRASLAASLVAIVSAVPTAATRTSHAPTTYTTTPKPLQGAPDTEWVE